jgi:hypothetical protein
MRTLRLTHPALDFMIDVRLREFDRRWLAVADLADTPDIGTGETPVEALRGALPEALKAACRLFGVLPCTVSRWSCATPVA